jgi:hypothetical protein
MSGDFEHVLRRCTVKLSFAGKSGHATGFFVAPGLILTCAHVVAAVVEPVKVSWQHQEDFVEAGIEKLEPAFDLALLRCRSTSSDPPCVYLDQDIRVGDELYIYGYSDDFPQGDPVLVAYEGLAGGDPPLLKFKAGQVRPGLSGSPVLNQRTGKVCGVVKLTRGRDTDLGGGAIPTTVIFSRWPELERQNRRFHWRDGRWAELLSRINERGLEGGPPLSPEEYRVRRGLLTQVKDAVAVRLRHSLHHEVLINLLMEAHPKEVEPVFGVGVKIDTQRSMPLPVDTEIIDVFDEDAVTGRLLILGIPGAGKTTTLLHLARDLVGRAETDADKPMPVLLDLSSWKDDGQPIASWLVAELHRVYRVRKDHGQRLLDEHSLLPLLDGLDELEPTRLEQCVRAINRHYQGL